MRKLFFLIATITIVVISVIAGFIWLSKGQENIEAQLVIEFGDVQIKHAEGIWEQAENGMLLFQSDSVKTGLNSSASIILFKSNIIRLDSNTEVTLKELLKKAGDTIVKLQQDAGRTWNTVLKVSGVDTYEVSTPTTVASVRGTTFDVNHHTNGSTDINVVNGSVNVSRNENGTKTDTIEVNESESVTVDPNATGQPLKKKPLEWDEWMNQSDQVAKENLERVKNELYERIEQYIPELKERYGMTDEELEALIDGYLMGYFDLPPETPDWIREIIELS